MSLSGEVDRTAAAILREFRLYQRRVVTLIDANKQILQHDPITSADCQTLEASINQLKADQNRLDHLTSELMEQEPSADQEAEVAEKTATIALNVVRIIGAIRDAQSNLSINQHELFNRRSLFTSTFNPSQGVNCAAQTKMPKLRLPTFDGDERKFLDFKNHFLRIVDENPNLKPIEKMSYLKGSLVDKAEKLLRDMTLSDENYTKAWHALLDRYEDSVAIIESHFEAFFAIPKIKSGNDIRDLIDQVDTSLRSLELNGESPDKWPGIITYFVTTRLDERTLFDWKKTITNRKKYPSWESLREYLKTAASALKYAAPSTSNTSFKREGKPTEIKKAFAISTSSCFVCNQMHLLINCDQFLSKTPRQRLDLIRRQNLCVNCFNSGHNSYDCRSRKVCKNCRRKHHTLLHLDPSSYDSNDTRSLNNITKSEPISQPPTPSSEQSTTSIPTSNTTCLKTTLPKTETVILPSAVTKFCCSSSEGTLRTLIDTCSQVTLISDAFVRRYRLPTFSASYPISLAVGGVNASISKQCSLELQSRFGDFSLHITANVISNTALSYSLHNADVSRITNLFQHYQPADPVFLNPVANISHVDLLLGAAYIPAILIGDVKKVDNIALQNTEFGWTILGQTSTPIQILTQESSCLLAIQDIDDRLKKFWEAEELSDNCNPKETTEQENCTQFVEKTLIRLPNGQFQVQLPFKEPISNLSNNRDRTIAYQRRFEANLTEPKKSMFHEFMREYKELNHMSPASSQPVQRYFIPMQAVLRPTSTTTKLRVVFNASAKTSTGKSLNDILLIGPAIQPDLFDVLVRFRSYPIAFTADIAKMYRCVLVHPNDRPMQSVLWREDPSQPPKEFELNTVTYGTAPASFLATKCLAVLANSAKNHATRDTILNNFYMDDLLAGASNVEDAVNLQKDIHAILKSAHFNLRKYQSNSQDVLSSIDSELIETQLSSIFGEKESISLLGLHWVPQDDLLVVKLPKMRDLTTRITKRELLSEVARIFDPLGILSPVTIREKLLIQRLWQEGLKWDQPVPENLAQKFCKLRCELSSLASFSIPRCIFAEPSSRINLIGFADASNKAYCAAIYMQSCDSSGSFSSRLICAKTRVASPKINSVPKLELCASLLLAQLIDRVRNLFQIELQSVYVFTDSEVVLSWLAKPPKTWKTFVANRVQKIISLTPFNRWGYVPTDKNAADLATRGLSVDSYLKQTIWTNGPVFLNSPIVLNQFIDDNLSLEKRKEKAFCNLSINTQSFFVTLFSRFSDLSHFLRVLAYVQLFISNTQYFCNSEPNIISPHKKLNETRRPICLSVDNLNNAECTVIKLTQLCYFAKECERLLQGKTAGKRSILRSLNPFIDSNGLLRSATRLANANASYDRKCPVVLPAQSHFVKLLIRHLHSKYFHATQSFIQTQILLRFYITGQLRSAIKNELKFCTTCARYTVNYQRQLMGDLPRDRLVISRPFSHVGIDLAGPFLCKPMVKRSKVRFKAYASVFVCFASRAVHIEVVQSESSEDFLNALKRFIARRGIPHTIYSDRGSNFKGVARYLNFQSEVIQNFTLNEKITWQFNPPRAPHRGGIWEAAVKAMKAHLIRVTKNQLLTYEGLSTLLTQIEGILNSRPLAYRHVNDRDFNALCPSHFLVGDSLVSLPETDSSPLKLSIYYKELRQRIDSFWHQWSRDYLAQLRSREKWQCPTPTIAVGDVVILREKDTKPAKWPLGRVITVFPDSKNVIRTIEVLFRGTPKIRDISSVIRLPLSDAI